MTNNKTIAYIEWVDAVSYDGSRQATAEEAKDYQLTTLASVGHLLHEDDEKVIIAADLQLKTGKYRYIYVKPKSQIKRLLKLEVPEKEIINEP